MSYSAAEPPNFLTMQTLGSLGATVVIVGAAYGASVQLLPASTTSKLRTLYIWHLADGLCHLSLEASYLYNSFFVYKELPMATADYPHPASLSGGVSYALPPSPFLGHRDRVYGAAFGDNPTALLWQEYAKADKRWGYADTTVVSLELLTVLLAGPIALWVSENIRKGAGIEGGKGGWKSARMWFWATVLATGELYGGFMTFAPEWLSGSENLDTSHWMYK